MRIKLVKPAPEFERSYIEYVAEWDKIGEIIVPYASIPNGRSFSEMLTNWAEDETEKAYIKGSVPTSLYFLTENNLRILGTLHCRHELNEYFLNFRGHIGYGVRPSERKKGYASLILKMALDIYRERNIGKVLLTCDKTNVVSAKIITSHGGILENETSEPNRITQRYWIKL